MELITLGVFILIALILVALGLFKSEHSELAIIGFFLIFILSMLILNGNITHKVGTSTNITCIYDAGNLTNTEETSRDIYENITWNGNFNRSAGFYLAIVGIVGMAGVFIGLKRSKGNLE